MGNGTISLIPEGQFKGPDIAAAINKAMTDALANTQKTNIDDIKSIQNKGLAAGVASTLTGLAGTQEQLQTYSYPATSNLNPAFKAGGRGVEVS